MGHLSYFRHANRIDPLLWHRSCFIKGLQPRWPSESASDFKKSKSGQLRLILRADLGLNGLFPRGFAPSYPCQLLWCLSSHYPAEGGHVFAYFVAAIWRLVKNCAGRLWWKGESNADFLSKRQVGIGPCFLFREASSGFVKCFEISWDES